MYQDAHEIFCVNITKVFIYIISFPLTHFHFSYYLQNFFPFNRNNFASKYLSPQSNRIENMDGFVVVGVCHALFPLYPLKGWKYFNMQVMANFPRIYPKSLVKDYISNTPFSLKNVYLFRRKKPRVTLSERTENRRSYGKPSKFAVPK